MSKLVLDLTKALLPERYAKCPKRMIIRKGQHRTDWDIVDAALTVEERQTLMAASVSGWRNDLPIAINNKRLPVGAIIEVVE